MNAVCKEIKAKVIGMQEDLNMIVHKAIDKKVETNGSIISLLDKRLGDMEKRLTEKMNSLDTVQMAEPARVGCTNLFDASQKPVIMMHHQFCFCGQY